MSRNMLMPESFVVDAYRVLAAVLSDDIDNKTIEACKRMETVIEAKIEALKKREAYSNSKTAETPEEREEARQQYLKLSGIKGSFIYSDEYATKLTCPQCLKRYRQDEEAILQGVPGEGDMSFCSPDCAEEWNDNYLEQQEEI